MVTWVAGNQLGRRGSEDSKGIGEGNWRCALRVLRLTMYKRYCTLPIIVEDEGSVCSEDIMSLEPLLRTDLIPQPLKGVVPA